MYTQYYRLIILAKCLDRIQNNSVRERDCDPNPKEKSSSGSASSSGGGPLSIHTNKT